MGTIVTETRITVNYQQHIGSEAIAIGKALDSGDSTIITRIFDAPDSVLKVTRLAKGGFSVRNTGRKGKGGTHYFRELRLFIDGQQIPLSQIPSTLDREVKVSLLKAV